MSFSSSHTPWSPIYTKEIFSFESGLILSLWIYVMDKEVAPSKWPIIWSSPFIKSWSTYSEVFMLFWYLVDNIQMPMHTEGRTHMQTMCWCLNMPLVKDLGTHLFNFWSSLLYRNVALEIFIPDQVLMYIQFLYLNS